MINIKGLHKYYKSSKETVHALKDINLEINDYGFVVILGKSGSGKSTLLNIIGGLDSFDDGEFYIFGQTIKCRDLDKYRNSYIGFVFQEFYIIDDFSVAKNISIALELQGYPKDEIEKKINEILRQVGLEGYNKRYPNELSGGEKQRIAIARALTKDPKIILADEPTGNLDSQTGKVILETLKKLSKTKLVIMVTHNIEQANTYADRIIQIKDGKIIDDYNKNKLDKVYKGNDLVESVIHLSQEKDISSEMMDYINKIIINKDRDLYITLCNRQYIIDELPDVIKQEKTLINKEKITKNELLFFKKSALPLKNALSLAFESILIRKSRLLLTVLLFVISLIFVGVASNISLSDMVTVTNLTLNKANIKKVPLLQFNKTSDRRGYGSKISFTKEDLNDFKENYHDIKFNANYFQYISFEELNASYQIQYEKNLYYSQQFKYVQIVDNSTPLTLIYGNLPQNNEILITDYMANMLIRYQVFQNTMEINYGTDRQYINDLIGNYFIYNDNNLRITGIVKTDYDSYNFNGVIENKLSLGLYETMYMTQETYGILFSSDSQSKQFMGIVSYLGNNNEENIQFFKEIHDKNNIVIRHETKYSTMLYNLEALRNKSQNVLFGIGVVFTLFTSVLIFSFISSSVVDRQKEIGTLRALGASGRDISKIFISEGLFISIFSSIIATGGLYLVIYQLNNAITKTYDTPLILLYVSIINISLVFLTGIFIALLSTLISVNKLIRMKPINVIKNLN